QAERADLVAERHREVVAELGGEQLGGTQLVFGGRWAEGPGDRHGGAAGGRGVGGEALDGVYVERRDLGSGVLVATLDDRRVGDDGGADVGRPGGPWGDGERRRRGEPERADAVEVAALNDGVGGVCRSEH